MRIHASDIAELCRMAGGDGGDEGCAEVGDGCGMTQMLMEFAGDVDRRVASNALWVLTHYKAPERRLLAHRQNELIDMALAAPDATSRRLLLTLLERQTFAADAVRTDFLDFCLGLMLSCAEPVGIRSLAMKLAYKMCRHYPELLDELRGSLDMLPEADTPGLRSCRRRLMQKLHKQ